MAEMPKRPHRPARYADLTGLIDAAGGAAFRSPQDVASTTAQALLDAAAAGEGDRLVGLADTVGIDTLAELWRDCEPVSLPGVLWALYLLRQWCRTCPDEVVRLWRDGEPYATPDALVAGAGPHPDPEAISRLADSILAGAYGGDFAVALDRAAAFFRVVAVGRRNGSPPVGGELAERNDRAARDLAAAAAAWRARALR
jgi:hypothetical protein